MLRVFRHHVPVGSLLQLLGDAALFFLCVLLAVALEWHGGSHRGGAVLGPALVFAALMTTLNTAFGIYQSDGSLNLATAIWRSVLALCVGTPLTYLLLAWLPDAAAARAGVFLAALLALAGLLLLRPALMWARGGRLATRRVLIIGAGEDVVAVEQGLATLRFPRYEIVGYVAALGDPHSNIDPREIAHTEPLNALAERLRVDEIIVAVRQQRGGILPLRELLDCRLRGILVMDLAGFCERVHREIPVDSLKSSSLIYGEGFKQECLQRVVKRGFDVMVAAAALIPALFIFMLIARRWQRKGTPLFESQPCIGRGHIEFARLRLARDIRAARRQRLRTASPWRRTVAGRWIDDLPQLINVLRGEMSLVGPVPERPDVAAAMRRQVPFYDLRHSVKPGVTGWARVRCAGQTLDPQKRLPYDLYYAKNQSLFLDLLILLETVRVIVFNERDAAKPAADPSTRVRPNTIHAEN